MCRLWSRSVCVALLLTCVACDDSSDSSGSKADAGPAAGGGGNGGRSDDGGKGGQGGKAGQGGKGGQGAQGGTKSNGSGGSGGSSSNAERPDVEPAECLPDPTSFSACGGDVVGKWRIASFCFDAGLEDLREDLNCPELTQKLDVDYRMLVEFTADGDYLASFSSDVKQDVTVPKSCLGSADADCSVLESDDPDAGDEGFSIVITDKGDSCLMAAVQQLSQGVVGSFETDGNQITVTDNDGPDTSDYCVDGDKLTVKSVNSATSEVTWGVFTRE